MKSANGSKREKKQLARGGQDQALEPRFNFDPRAVIAVGSNARHRERLSQQRPVAWTGESPADAAIFEDAAFSSLPPDLVPQVTAVRAALQDALAARGDDALKHVTAIPRGSPLSEWRLFIRGLIDWLANDSSAAGEAWRRLDPERRPGRIATTMMLALRSDLEQAPSPPIPGIEPAAGDKPSEEAQVSAWDRTDAEQLYCAKLLRRVRFDRAALRVAETGLKIPEESKELLLGPRRIQWLAKFVAEYGDTEPDLVAALSQAALARAAAQTYSNLFDEAIRKFQGPRHDPRNRLLTFFYYSRFANDSAAEQKTKRALNEYLKRDLPENESLSTPLRNAITSHIHLQEALVLMRPAHTNTIFDLFLTASENTKAIRGHLLAAVKAVPAHGAVYKAHVEWIKSKLDHDRLGKAEQERLEKELAVVMRNWSQGVPDEAEPRLWLVDYLLENEQLDEARPHVDFLAASRQDNPRVRAAPWKWQILEALRLCRRKAWLAEVPARLDEAEALWPAWLPKQWLPYLRAAWTLRSGQLEAFEKERQRICEEAGRVRDSLADACMMLGAAQQLRATAAELKPLRTATDQALKMIAALPVDDLLETSGFFWDLHRVQLIYPAYRMHGKTIGNALFPRLKKNSKMVREGINDERIHKAVLWGSEYRFWPNGNETKLPAFFSIPAIQRHPAFAAAKLNAFLKERYLWGIKKCQELGPLVREAAATERDVYYRHWYLELADRLDDAVAKDAARYSGSPFGNMFDEWEEEEDNDEDPLGYDPNCDCPDCRAARQKHQRASTPPDRVSKKRGSLS